MPLSTLAAGSFFSLVGVVPATKYLLTKDTGSTGSKLVAYDLLQSRLVEFDNTTPVTELVLSVGIAPVFTI